MQAHWKIKTSHFATNLFYCVDEGLIEICSLKRIENRVGLIYNH